MRAGAARDPRLIRRLGAAPVLLACLALFATSLASVAQQPPHGLDDYLREHWWGVRKDDVVALFDASDVPRLEELLASDTPYCGAVVSMLVILGDERAVDALIAFVEKPYADPSLANVYESARGGAITGLGQLVRRIGSERALTYLIGGLTPDVWAKRNVRGVAAWTNDYQEYDTLLGEYAIHGLAYSGDPRAGEALRALQRSPTPEQARLRKGLDKTLELWIETYDRVAATGLDPAEANAELQRRGAAEPPAVGAGADK